ncbi:uncharacterized protein TNCV_4450951 [Trichonephila clavipes]|nr:uncharacterized protein TNCV_4450951 [Trichonephila clavipes]
MKDPDVENSMNEAELKVFTRKWFDITEQGAKRCLARKRNHAKQCLLSLEWNPIWRPSGTDTSGRFQQWNSSTEPLAVGTDAPGPLHQWNSSSEPLTVGTDAPGRLPHWNSSNESLTLGTDVPGPLHQWNFSSEPLTVGTDAPGRIPHWNFSSESLTLATDAPGRINQWNTSSEPLILGTDAPRLLQWNSSREHLTLGTDAPERLPQWNSSSEHLTLGTDAPGLLSQSNSSREHLTVGRKGLNVPRVPSTRSKLISWFKQRRRSGSTHKWGSHLPRVVVTLHLVNESIFSPGNWLGIGQEISYKLTFQLLHRLANEKSGDKIGQERIVMWGRQACDILAACGRTLLKNGSWEPCHEWQHMWVKDVMDVPIGCHYAMDQY